MNWKYYSNFQESVVRVIPMRFESLMGFKKCAIKTKDKNSMLELFSNICLTSVRGSKNKKKMKKYYRNFLCSMSCEMND